MKKTIIMIITLSLFFMSGGVFAQKKKVKVESPEVKAKIESLILDAEKKIDNPLKLNRAIRRINTQLLNYWNSDVFVSDETKRNVTIRLIKIFNKIDDFETNEANKKRIIETIGLNDNSSEAHQFFLKVLNSGNKRYREHALWSLNPTGVHGDDIYDEIKRMVKKGILEESRSLPALKKANSQRALPEIQKFVKGTNNLKEFSGAGLLLCFYNDPDAIDVLFDRYGYFNNKAQKARKKGDNYVDNVIIPTKLLLEYVQKKEGKRLKIALDILSKEGTTDEEEFPLILPKLKSKNIITRKAVITFLENQVRGGSVKKAVVIPILEEAMKNEKDKELKVRIKRIIKEFKERKWIR